MTVYWLFRVLLSAIWFSNNKLGVFGAFIRIFVINELACHKNTVGGGLQGKCFSAIGLPLVRLIEKGNIIQH